MLHAAAKGLTRIRMSPNVGCWTAGAARVTYRVRPIPEASADFSAK
jgi:hypothetical protein